MSILSSFSTLRSRAGIRFLGGIHHVSGLREPWVALTFDDGPGPLTAGILDTLRDHETTATFFMLGAHARLRPGLVARAVREGHEIGNHTDQHPVLHSIGWRETWSELRACDRSLARAGVPRPALTRPCYGWTSYPYAALSALRGQRRVLWSLDGADWLRPPARQIAGSILSRAAAGDIILLHDGSDRPETDPDADRATTAAALPLLLDGLRQKNLRPVTLGALLAAGIPAYSRIRPVYLPGDPPKNDRRSPP